MNTSTAPTPLLASPFRPFFLLTGLYAIVMVVGWMAFLLGGYSLPLGWSPLHWHSHEMLFGLVSAAIAGFVLTAMCNWTGAAPLTGVRLLALVLLWVAGRVVMWLASWLPIELVAIVEGAFLPVLAIYIFSVLARYNNKRNYILVAVLSVLSLANICMHVGFITGKTQLLLRGDTTALYVIMVLMIIIGGRIIPAFTGNWLRNNQGNPESVKTSPTWDKFTLIVSALLIPTIFIPNLPLLTASIALVAAVANGVRLYRWSGWLAAREPILWILHIAYGWIVLALLFKGLAELHLVSASVWQHALGVGAMGTLILGVMTRVALGHTGRPMRLPSLGIIIYIAITVAAVSRVITALGWCPYSAGLIVAASGWVLSFCIFSWLYWSILTSPRADGRAG